MLLGSALSIQMRGNFICFSISQERAESGVVTPLALLHHVIEYNCTRLHLGQVGGQTSHVSS